MQLNLSCYQPNIDYLNYDILCKPQGNHKKYRSYTKEEEKGINAYKIQKKINKTQWKATREEKRHTKEQKRLIENKEQNDNIKSFVISNNFKYKWIKLSNQKT